MCSPSRTSKYLYFSFLETSWNVLDGVAHFIRLPTSLGMPYTIREMYAHVYVYFSTYATLFAMLKKKFACCTAISLCSS